MNSMTEIVNLDEVRAKLKAAKAAVVATPLTDGERLNIAVESLKLAYESDPRHLRAH
jgi:hypothetical protein